METPNWGLLMLTSQHNKISHVAYDEQHNMPELAGRFQLWKLMDRITQTEKYVALGHFPFRSDECAEDSQFFSHQGKRYCEFINRLLTKYADKSLTIAADFNCNPYLISAPKDRALDHIENNSSQLLKVSKNNRRIHHKVTVDGILLSIQEKQKNYRYTLSSTLRFSPGLFQPANRSSFLMLADNDNSSQKRRDKIGHL